MLSKCKSNIKSKLKIYFVNGREYYNYSKGLEVNLFPIKKIILPIKDD